MKQYKISAESFSQPGAQPDAVMDPADIADLQRLAGIQSIPVGMSKLSETGSNISVTGNEKAQLMKKHSIKPGTPEWFQLWFSRPYLTNEPPVGK
jgi:hypothetical protein